MLLCVGLPHPLAQLSQMLPTVKLLVFAPIVTHIQNGYGVLYRLGFTPQAQESDTFNYV
ncbi:hypothetical protein H6G97_25410 [Nostoc flagelliforme FACHB-838]|uniref:Uncharacterized protein n=1 Tax=Nostoc flagelliforme FACHB-838 TaxID=2692904 RepID=A0ABR8DWU2_9NOSO|nr:hypothetical protein [Nostoc flagelliforme]MBD2532740.1 hypothetical protein [Nostoc flagelliforme FACHB-838]